MRQIIIILIVQIGSTGILSGQSKLDEELLRLEQDIFLCSSDSVKTKLILQKLDLHLEANELSESSFNEVRRVNYMLIEDAHVRQRFLWNASLLSFLNKRINHASYYYQTYQDLYPDTTIAAGLLQLLIYNGADTAQVALRVKQLTGINDRFSCLECLNEVIAYKKRGETFYILSSAIVPGSGSIFLGHAFKGLNSAVLVGAAGYAVFTMLSHHLYVNGIAWGLAFGVKFYGGNLLLTEKLFNQKQMKKKSRLAKKCEVAFSRILEEYPVNFR